MELIQTLEKYCNPFYISFLKKIIPGIVPFETRSLTTLLRMYCVATMCHVVRVFRINDGCWVCGEDTHSIANNKAKFDGVICLALVYRHCKTMRNSHYPMSRSFAKNDSVK